MKKLLIILFIALNCNAQATKKVLAKGVIYGWQMIEITDTGNKVTCFSFTSGITRNSSGLEIGIVSSKELAELIVDLRTFAEYPLFGNYYTRNDSYIISKQNTETVILSDYKGGYLNLSKSNAKAVATDIEKSLILMK